MSARPSEKSLIDIRQALQQLQAQLDALTSESEFGYGTDNLLSEGGDLILSEDDDRICLELNNAREGWEATALGRWRTNFGHLLKEDGDAILTEDGEYISFDLGCYLEQVERRLVAGGL